jgi:hypothetical protein
MMVATPKESSVAKGERVRRASGKHITSSPITLKRKPASRTNTSTTRSVGVGKRSDKDIILLLHNHFHKIGKSNVAGFHWMDKEGNGAVTSGELVKILKEAGISITNARAKELISGYVTLESVMDIPGYIRFMASAYTYKDD